MSEEAHDTEETADVFLPMDRKPLRARTIILSDVHLGTPDCKVREVNHFLKYTRCEKLILNGDIIDAWQLKRSGRWTKAHTRFIRLVLKKLEKKDIQVVYLRGNHDDVLSSFLPLELANLSIVEDHIHEGVHGNYYVLHGDVFDAVTKNFVFLAHLGDWGYRFLMKVNRLYNKFRAWRGKEYYSISKVIKAKVKSAVSFVSKFESELPQLARTKGCIGVICGHIHTPADKQIDGIHYLNSGDWVESMTAILEHDDGRFELIDFERFRQLYPMEDDETAAAEVLEPEDTPAQELLANAAVQLTGDVNAPVPRLA